jgi:hypothetical protein
VDEAVVRNIEAAKQLAHIVSSSMGPNGTWATEPNRRAGMPLLAGRLASEHDE